MDEVSRYKQRPVTKRMRNTLEYFGQGSNRICRVSLWLRKQHQSVLSGKVMVEAGSPVCRLCNNPEDGGVREHMEQ